MKRMLTWIAAAVIGAALLPAQGVHASTLFGLVDTGELYVSADGGTAWQIRSTLPVHDAVGLAAAASSSELYLATRSGSVYFSGNAGQSWTAVGAITASDVAGFGVGPFGALLALTSSGTLYSSSNGGATFTAIAALAGSSWTSLTRGPLGRLYALASTGGVAQSVDQGVTWSIVGAVSVSNAVSLRRLGNDLYLLTGTGEIYRSINYGATWTAVSALTASGMSALLDVSGSLVAASETGEVASTSNGVSWTWIGAINQMRVVALGSDVPQITGVPIDEAPPRFSPISAAPNPRYGPGGAVFGFSAERADRVRLELYDAAGRLRAMRPFTWVSSAGSQSLSWDPAGLPSGTYVIRVTFGSGRALASKWTVVR